MDDIEADTSSWERTAKDLVSGAAGGIAQVLLGKSVFVGRVSSVLLHPSDNQLCSTKLWDIDKQCLYGIRELKSEIALLSYHDWSGYGLSRVILMLYRSAFW